MKMMWRPDIPARLLSTNFREVCEGKEKFQRTKHGDDTIIFLYAHSRMCMQVKECARFSQKLPAEVKWQFL